MPFLWAFAESDYNTPCMYNEGNIPMFVPTLGIFSGFFYIDREASWNGSSFTLTVFTTNPVFFYMIDVWDWAGGDHCSSLATYAKAFNLTNEIDVLFALNPVTLAPL